MYRIGVEVLRAAPTPGSGDTAPVPTDVRHAEEDHLLSTIIAQCSTVKVIRCEADVASNDTLFHPTHVIRALSTLSSIVELQTNCVAHGAHLHCVAQMIRSAPNLQTVVIAGALHTTTLQAQSRFDFARKQLAIALA